MTNNKHTWQFFRRQLRRILSAEQIIDSPIERYALGADASMYRMTPKLVLRVRTPSQMQKLLRLAKQCQQALTFRAAGTSLSGQAVTDQILVMIDGLQWKHYEILQNGQLIKLGPALRGSQANALLKPLARMIGPDPASIDSCQIGGIAANNASGMCCGVDRNSYHTMAAMQLMLADGSRLDTACAESRQAFMQQHPELIAGIRELAVRLKDDTELSQRVRHKYRLKNTTGYGLNALLDFEDPLDILAHLMIGSEGTLGVIESITYRTLPDHPHKLTALLIFADAHMAYQALNEIAKMSPEAVELLDGLALRCMLEESLLDAYATAWQPAHCALLIEISRSTHAELTRSHRYFDSLIQSIKPIWYIAPTDDKAVRDQLWRIRKGTFPKVSAQRPPDSTVIIEDIAVPRDQLAAAIVQLRLLLSRHNYAQAIIFGHALSGNLHFVITPQFNKVQERDNYHRFMCALSQLVCGQFGGSLKAEHGTGRNISPFVEAEWGHTGYQLMKDLKSLLDPDNILNPGVIINGDKLAHLRHLKPLEPVDDLINPCTECGFCEPACPSRSLTLTPRQRIVMARLATAHPEIIEREQKHYNELMFESCATTGACQLRCPLGINTGHWVKTKREYKVTEKFLRQAYRKSTKLANQLGALARIFYYPAPSRTLEFAIHTHHEMAEKIDTCVYFFPSCALRMDAERLQRISSALRSLCSKAGFDFRSINHFEKHCCGLTNYNLGDWQSATEKAESLKALILSRHLSGKNFYIVSDSEACWQQLEQMQGDNPFHHLADFCLLHLFTKLKITPLKGKLLVHTSCSARRNGQAESWLAVVRHCAEQIECLKDIECCGFAGSKGFTYPDLNRHVLGELHPKILEEAVCGVSDSISCSWGLNKHTSIRFIHPLELVTQLAE